MVEMGGYKGRLEAIIFYVTGTYEFLIHAMHLIFYEKVEMDGYKGRLEAIVFLRRYLGICSKEQPWYVRITCALVLPWYVFKGTALVQRYIITKLGM